MNLKKWSWILLWAMPLVAQRGTGELRLAVRDATGLEMAASVELVSQANQVRQAFTTDPGGRAIARGLPWSASFGGPEITGVIEDGNGRPLPDILVELRTASGMPLARAQTDARGQFRFATLPPGSYLLEVEIPGFQKHQTSLRVEPGMPVSLHRLVLGPERLYTQLSVTALPGSVEELQETPQLVAVISAEEVHWNAHPTLANSLARAPGVHLQQSTAGQGSPFLRGLTGFHALQTVDGVRFNNSTFRFGPNQYLALLEPSQVQRVETSLGPAGAEYGSDALGGAIHVLTPPAWFSETPRWQKGGHLSGFLGSADLSAGTAARFSASNQRLAGLVGGTWRHYNDLRPGGGVDSHHVLRRLLGLNNRQIRQLLGSRQRETAFAQFGGQGRLSFRIRSNEQLSLWFQHSAQRGVRGYKDLWGGLGRLQAAFTPQALNFFYLRHERHKLGALDSLTSTFSLNSQKDGFVSQGLNHADPILTERTRVDSYGYSVRARTHRGLRQTIVFGGEFYDERIRSTRLLSANGAAYRTLAIYGQSSVESRGRRMRANAGGRLTGVWFGGRAFHDATFNSALTWRATEAVRFHLVIARGFRAPNVNDLGTLGLQDLGFEVPAEAVARAGGLIGSNSGEAARSIGRPVEPLRSERLFNYEAGFAWHGRRTYLRAQVFDAELYDAIARRTVVFPAATPPRELAGIPVRPVAASPEQAAQGVSGVATPFDPRAVKAFVNVGRQRYAGTDLLLRQKLPGALELSAQYSFLLGRELRPNGPVRRLPPQQGAVALLYRPARRWWAEVCLEVAGTQRRLSGGDLSDERIGAERSQRDIAALFGAARLQPFIREGIFQPTGETMAQIQERLLPASLVPADHVRVPLFWAAPGYAALHLRAGFLLTERNKLTLHSTNLTDRNYRRHGSGLDAPGFHLFLGWEFRF